MRLATRILTSLLIVGLLSLGQMGAPSSAATVGVNRSTTTEASTASGIAPLPDEPVLAGRFATVVIRLIMLLINEKDPEPPDTPGQPCQTITCV